MLLTEISNELLALGVSLLSSEPDVQAVAERLAFLSDEIVAHFEWGRLRTPKRRKSNSNVAALQS